MKTRLRIAFTLVELLVVISIIALLAGLLLPAINSARESGRRAVCINNQSQLALGVLTYDANNKHYPPMRDFTWVDNSVGFVGTKSSYNQSFVASWIVYILPNLEMTAGWNRVSMGKIGTGTNPTSKAFETVVTELALPILRCPSGNMKPAAPGGTNYVVNGGYQNCICTVWTGKKLNQYADPAPKDQAISTATASSYVYNVEPAKFADAVFFDNCLRRPEYVSKPETGNRDGWDYYYTYHNETFSTTEYISTHDGTSNTLMLSENLDDRVWIEYTNRGLGQSGTVANYRVFCYGEESLAFCFPYTTQFGNYKALYDAVAPLAEYGDNEAVYCYKAYAAAPPNCPATAAATNCIPVYINEGLREPITKFVGQRIDTGGKPMPGSEYYRTARPSSQHPGVVVAAFCDRSVRTINEKLDKMAFVRLCQPGSGKVKNPKDLD